MKSRIPIVAAVGIFMASVAFSAGVLPHTEQIAPGVFAAGFADRYQSANCGWVGIGDQTLLIDLPHGIAISDFISEVESTTRQPVRSYILTGDAGKGDLATQLEGRGITRTTVPPQRAKIPGLSKSVELIPYLGVPGGQSAAVYLPDTGVLFAGPAGINGPRAELIGTDIESWIETLSELRRLDPKQVVPGYGSWGNAMILERQQLRFAELRRQVAYHIAMGIPLARLESSILIPAGYYSWMPYDKPTSKDIQWIYNELTIPRAPFRGTPPTREDTRAHALVLIGDRPHEPGHIEEGLRPVFDAVGVIPHFLFDYRGLTAENLRYVRLLVILRDGYIFPEKEGVMWMTSEQQIAVAQFVEEGGGFLNLHNSMGLYPENGPYLDLVGGRYIGHGPLERFRTEVVDPDHPVTRGVTDFFTADEQHTPPYQTNKVHLLLRNRSDDGKVVAAAGWAYEPGRGRLCHLANGHTREALLHPMYQRLMQNAVQWCLRRDP